MLLRSKKKTRKYMVRYHSLAGTEILYQKIHVPWWSYVIFPFNFLLFCKNWEDWLLLNCEEYEIEYKIIKKLDEIEKLYTDLEELNRRRKADAKEIDASTRQTKGTSAPFPVWLSDEYVKTCSNWLDKPDGSWRGKLNARMFKDLHYKKSESVRDKLGMDEHPTAKGDPNLTGFTLKEFDGIADALDDDGLPNIITFKESDQQKKNNNNNNNNQQNRKNRNRNQNNQDDWDN